MSRGTPPAQPRRARAREALLLAGDTLMRYLRLWQSLLAPGRDRLAAPTVRHYVIGSALLLALPVFLAWHWLGLLLDEILHPAYRRQAVERPLFIVGLPRSGTTTLHHSLADDPHLTTFRAWECLFALSITWRRGLHRAARLDRHCGRPLGRLLDRLEARLTRGLAGVHDTGLHRPEEDYLAFLPVLACFILVLPWPDAPDPWRAGRFDTALTPAQRSRLMAFYRRCIQRHLYAHGGGQRFLSKNAAFAPLLGSLLDTFPDAAVIWCRRDPVRAVSSQLATVHPALLALHGDYDRVRFRNRLVDQLAFYDERLHTVLGALAPRRAVSLPLTAMRRHPVDSVVRAYCILDRPLAPSFRDRLTAGAPNVCQHRSGHRHTAADFGLSPAELQRRFRPVGAAIVRDAANACGEHQHAAS